MYNPVELLVLIFNLTTAASQGKSSPFSLQSVPNDPEVGDHYFKPPKIFLVNFWGGFVMTQRTAENRFRQHSFCQCFKVTIRQRKRESISDGLMDLQSVPLDKCKCPPLIILSNIQ